jgi:hypothetical protein
MIETLTGAESTIEESLPCSHHRGEASFCRTLASTAKCKPEGADTHARTPINTTSERASRSSNSPLSSVLAILYSPESRAKQHQPQPLHPASPPMSTLNMSSAANDGVAPSRGPTKELCSWVGSLSTEQVPPELLERAKYLVLDGLACALIGAHLPWSSTAGGCGTGNIGERRQRW